MRTGRMSWRRGRFGSRSVSRVAGACESWTGDDYWGKLGRVARAKEPDIWGVYFERLEMSYGGHRAHCIMQRS